MKKTLSIILSVFLLVVASGTSFAAKSYGSKVYKPKTVKVKSYNRKDGTFVKLLLSFKINK